MQMNEISEIYQPEDRKICEDLLLSPHWKIDGNRSVNELVILIGKYFSGAPYGANTIEKAGEEILIINLRQFDCFTFVETVVVLAGLIKMGKTAFEDYTSQLRRIRYRRGVLNGYSSRLHYFFDWIRDNEEKEIIKDAKADIGGKPCLKEINFMTKHPESYPELKCTASYREMLEVEKRLSMQPMYIIPKADLRHVEDKIEEGNVIGIATTVTGLDMAHVGFAIRVKKRIHLFHASTEEQKVVISEDTLDDYLAKRETFSGIIVGKVI
jgi:hypothetical protein